MHWGTRYAHSASKARIRAPPREGIGNEAAASATFGCRELSDGWSSSSPRPVSIVSRASLCRSGTPFELTEGLKNAAQA